MIETDRHRVELSSGFVWSVTNEENSPSKKICTYLFDSTAPPLATVSYWGGINLLDTVKMKWTSHLFTLHKGVNDCGCKKICKITQDICNTTPFIAGNLFWHHTALIISAWHKLQLKCSLRARANRLHQWYALTSLGMHNLPWRDVTHWYEWAPAVCESTGSLM